MMRHSTNYTTTTQRRGRLSTPYQLQQMQDKFDALANNNNTTTDTTGTTTTTTTTSVQSQSPRDDPPLTNSSSSSTPTAHERIDEEVQEDVTVVANQHQRTESMRRRTELQISVMVMRIDALVLQTTC